MDRSCPAVPSFRTQIYPRIYYAVTSRSRFRLGITMTIDLYYLPPSPPCRSVMMLGKHLGVRFNLKVVNVLKGEQLKSSFKKMNPQHTIPTIDDNGFILWESRPIMTYLVMKYAKNDSLYPRDPKQRSVVEHRLYFDIGILYDSIITYHAPVIFGKMDAPPEQCLPPMERAFELLDKYLQDSNFVAGETLTVADFSIASSVSSAKAFGFDIERYDNVATWYERCKKAMEKCGFEEINEAGARVLGSFYKANLKT
ncbi:glutathione S-transferase 1-1-like [Copidosoma floridanum]|uniref:glutathione S-transferase 1-1-like n=1 Tax=Copidosoma floridanum TaxID=29053 RepID=UPI0006C98DC8|nr:glutathione S-transferase 1-1-like [Copidosoma floridanum]